MIQIIPETELILNADGSVYHLNLHPEDIADTIILVGDPDRVPLVSQYFDLVQLKKQKREFVTHTGVLNNKRLTVISTGIGTDNIDIVLNELDALANINLKTRRVNDTHKALTLVRIGTSGTMQPHIPVDTLLVSESAIGLDSLLWFYNLVPDAVVEPIECIPFIKPYFVNADAELVLKFNEPFVKGITVTCSGFYAPQGRALRANIHSGNLIKELSQIDIAGKKPANFEMETSAILALSKLFGFKATAVNAIVANRATHNFSANPNKTIEKAIELTLKILTS